MDVSVNKVLLSFSEVFQNCRQTGREDLEFVQSVKKLRQIGARSSKSFQKFSQIKSCRPSFKIYDIEGCVISWARSFIKKNAGKFWESNEPEESMYWKNNCGNNRKKGKLFEQSKWTCENQLFCDSALGTSNRSKQIFYQKVK